MTIYYHVTETKSVRSIRKKGLMRFRPSHWIKASGERYGNGEIFVFEAYHDALRWAGKMDWHLHQGTGTGKISVVELESGDQPWEVDDSDPMSQAGKHGAWLKSQYPVPPEQIIGAEPVDLVMLKTLFK